MAPKKQAKPNAFFLFAQDLMKKQGYKFKSMKDACDGAAPLWAKMSASQKQPYEEMAKSVRGTPTKLTSEGISVAELTQEFNKKHEAEGIARANIRCIMEDARQRNALDTEMFFVVHCNVFCYYSTTDSYWPAEIAVLAFNLREGIKPENVFHRMVHPGSLPIGYAFTAKQHADETHMINLPTDDEETNLNEVYLELRTFIEEKTSQGGSRLPILYTNKKHTKVVQNILDDWVTKYEPDESPEMFKVYDLHLMLFHLKNSAAGDEVWSSTNFSEREIDKDVYAYVPEIACEFHAFSEKILYCSRSTVCRYAFMTCDNCCPELDIEVIEGRHIPANSAIPDTSSRKSFSSRRSKSTRSLQSEFSNDSNSEIWETESIGSQFSDSSSVSNLDDDFPVLNSGRSQSRASNYSAQTSGSRSYAGATGKSMPPAVETGLAKLSLSSNYGLKTPGWGRDSNTSATAGSSQDFPPIARGRGFRRQAPKKPGPEAGRL